MSHVDDLERLLVATHALTRVAAVETGNTAPSAQWRALAILSEHGQLRLGELAALGRVTQPGMTRLIGIMAAAGLVERAADASDPRVPLVTATSRGLETYAAWRKQLAEALLPRFADLDSAEWEALHTVVGVLAARTGAAVETR